MADTAQFVIELVDKMSGPLKAQQAALDALTAHLEAAKGGLSDYEKSSHGAAKGSKGLVAGLKALELNAYVELFEKVGEAAEKLFDILEKPFDLAIEATELKTDTEDALEAFLGSQQAAENTYSQIRSMGGELALGIQEGSKMAQQLAAAGIESQESLLSSIRAIQSVKLVLGDEGAGKLQTLLTRTAQTGQFKVSGKQLTGTGIRTDELTAQLSKQLGVVPAVVKQRMAEGKIRAADGISAIEQVINNGKIGELAQKQVLDFGNQIKTLKSFFFGLFDSVKTGPFLEAFHSLVELFDDSTESGKILKGAITEVLDKLFELATEAVPYVRIGIELLEVAALEVYIAYKKWTDSHQELLGKLERMGGILWTFIVPSLQAIGDKFQFILDVGGVLVEWLGTLADSVLTAVLAIWDAITGKISPGEMLDKLEEAGKNLVLGLIKGIGSMVGVLGDKVARTAQHAVDTFNSVFGNHSPSVVMQIAGMNLMAGLDKGIQANDAGPQGALADSVRPPEAPSSRGDSGSTSSQSSSSVSVTIGPGAIVINGVANVEQLRQALPGELAAMFEQMGLSVGAA